MQTDSQVRFTARLAGEYQLIVGTKLSAFTDEQLVAKYNSIRYPF